MRSTLASASIIYLIGCVIPTPLEEEPQPVNYPPVLTKGDPPFGPVAHQSSDFFDLKVFADDPNVQDVLKIRLFRGGAVPTERNYVNFEKTLISSNNPNDPLERTGSFGTLQYCNVFTAGNFYVVVADRDFSDTPLLQHTSPGGLTNENHWELMCN